MFFYKTEEMDFIMRQNRMTPRYAGLARKAFSFYLGDLYNPEEIDLELEFLFRQFIKAYVELKVFDKEPYDWPLIDNFFRKTLYNEGYTFLSYDQSILDKGYNGVMRGKLTVHTA